MGTSYNPLVVTDGLVIYLDAANPRSYPGSGITWYNLSRGGNNATLNGITYSSNEGGILLLDGSTSYISVSNALVQGESDLTISGWSKYTGSSFPERTTLCSIGGELEINLYRAKLEENIHGPVFSENLAFKDVWFNWAVTIDDSNVKLYLNGQLEKSHASGVINVTTEDLIIGKKFDDSQFFEGAIGTINIYNRVLSDDELLKMFKAIRLRHSVEDELLPYNSSTLAFEVDTSLADGDDIGFNINAAGAILADWDDGSVSNTNTYYNYNQHTYSSPGIYQPQLHVTGGIPNQYYLAANLRTKITKILSFSNAFTNYSYIFRNFYNLTQVPDTLPSGVTSMSSMFIGCSNFNHDISNWDVSNITSLAYTFASSGFNKSIDKWDVSSVSSFDHTFSETSFNQPLNSWDVSSCVNMQYMFSNNNYFNQTLRDWDTSSVTTMSNLFRESRAFNQNIGRWDVSNVLNFSYMFWRAPFNNGGSGSINEWNVSSATNMFWMFYETSFNQPIGSWDTSNVTTMHRMFGRSSFNQDIGSWNTSACTDMQYMFWGNTNFNNGGSPSIGQWDVSNVTSMYAMFENCNFNQDISAWNLAGFTTSNALSLFKRYKSFSTSVYDNILNGWNANKLATANGVADWRTDLTPDFGSSKYTSAAATARQQLVDYGWTITDGGLQT